MSYRESAEKAKAVLVQRGFAPASEPIRDGVLADLHIQWTDHFHMRDQSWKTLNNAALFFVGVVGLEIYRGTPHIVMVAAYSALVLVSVLGLLVAWHHRHIQQKIKFPIIVRYEVLLGLTPLFDDILDEQGKKGLSTSTFIVGCHAALGFISLLLLLRKSCAMMDWQCPVALVG
jgi:hypothetical protein